MRSGPISLTTALEGFAPNYRSEQPESVRSPSTTARTSSFPWQEPGLPRAYCTIWRKGGGEHGDDIKGGAGSDYITGGDGRDSIEGGGLNDNINARDGERDVVFCGPGQDAVFADSFDVTDQCEKTFKENVNVNPVHP
jgi:hypothetical protein